MACAEDSPDGLPDPATLDVPCSTVVMCLDQRICSLALASLPATWCASSPRPHALLAECEEGYSAITFSTFTASSKYFYRNGTLVAAVELFAEAGSDIACGPDGPFHPPRCALGTDLCAPAAAR